MWAGHIKEESELRFNIDTTKNRRCDYTCGCGWFILSFRKQRGLCEETTKDFLFTTFSYRYYSTDITNEIVKI